MTHSTTPRISLHGLPLVFTYSSLEIPHSVDHGYFALYLLNMAFLSAFSTQLFSRKSTTSSTPTDRSDRDKGSSNDKATSQTNQDPIDIIDSPPLVSPQPPATIASPSPIKPPSSRKIESDCNDCASPDFYRRSTPDNCDNNRQTDCNNWNRPAAYRPSTPVESIASDVSSKDNKPTTMDPNSTMPMSFQTTVPGLAAMPTPGSLKRKAPSTPSDQDSGAKRMSLGTFDPFDIFRPNEGESSRGRLIRRTVSGVEIPREAPFESIPLEDEDEKDINDAEELGGELGRATEDGGGEEEGVEDMAIGSRYVADTVQDGEDGVDDEGDSDAEDLFAHSFGKKAPIADDNDDSSDSDVEVEANKKPTLEIPSTDPVFAPLPTTHRSPTSNASKTKPTPKPPTTDILPIDPTRHISPHHRANHLLHTRVLAFLPRIPLATHRYWIAVVPPNTNTRTLNSEKQMTWIRGHRKTTVKTVFKTYAMTTVSEGFELQIGGTGSGSAKGEKGWAGEVPWWGVRMEEVDYFGDKKVVFRAVEVEDGRAERADGAGTAVVERGVIGGAVFRGLVKEGVRKEGVVQKSEVIVLDD